jgi:hypothetical protein
MTKRHREVVDSRSYYTVPTHAVLEVLTIIVIAIRKKGNSRLVNKDAPYNECVCKWFL